VTRRALHRRILAHRMRRWSPGPYSWIERLRDLAFDCETCHIITVRLDQGA
jgi:hypothetical protein